MYKNVLVALDLSDETMDNRLLAAAEKLAGEDGHLKCIHVVENIPTYVLVEVPPDLMKNVVGAASEDLKKRVEAAGLSAKSQVKSGKPADVILAAASDMGAEVIVVGSHKPGMQDLFLGSVAARVVRHAECDVLVRRPA